MECKACGAALPPMAHPGNPRKWCSESCRVWAYQNPGKSRSSDWRDRVPECHKKRVCARPECSREFTNVNLAQRYCSISCGQKSRARPKGPCAEPGCTKTANTRGLCGTHYNILWALEVA